VVTVACKPGSVPGSTLPGGDHSSGPRVAAGLEQPTRGHRAGHPPPAWSCSGWGLPTRVLLLAPVGSYPTFSPLPAQPAVCFLWHFPRGYPHRALPGTLPCGARTFLWLHLATSGRPATVTSSRICRWTGV